VSRNADATGSPDSRRIGQGRAAAELADHEVRELMVLVVDAWEQEGEERARAAERIVSWWDALPFRRMRASSWYRQLSAAEERRDRLVAVMRETDPRHLHTTRVRPRAAEERPCDP
jgi:hypothetical protein